MTASTASPADARLDALRQEFEHEASFNLVFVVLTVGATLIASLGLLANSPGVVIGAMVVAPWILPLQAMAFEILRGRLPMFLRALRTLLLGVALTALLVIPLGTSFFRLVDRYQQETKAQQIETVIEQQLHSSTITLGGDPAIDLVGIAIDWQKDPPPDPGPGRRQRSRAAHVRTGGGGAGLHQWAAGAAALSVVGATHRGGPDRSGNRSQSPRAGGAASAGAATVAGRTTS